MLRHSAIIHERSTMIRIPRSPSSREEERQKEREKEKEKKKEKETECSLKENIFDPFKCSPPNDFMLKLELRMSKYFNK
jgi:hypothetical protein